MRNKRKLIKTMVFILLIVMSTAIVGCSKSNDADSQVVINEQYEGSIDVWSWNEELLTTGMIDKFNEVYPNINVNLITIPHANNAYTTKLVATLRSGTRAPDVYLAEAATVKKLCNLGYYENLSTDEYNAEELVKDMVPYTVNLGRNDEDNSIRALSWQAAPGGFFYRRSLAKQYFGTDNPDEIQAMMTTMEDFFKLGERLMVESNNSVKLLASYGELFYPYLGNRTTGWVKDGKLVIDPQLLEYIDMAEKIKEKGYSIDAQQWTEKWTNGISSGEVFGYMLPTWGLISVLEANAPETKGDWAFVEAPTPYHWGGTWIGMYKNSQKKDLSWLFVEFLTTNEEFLNSHANDVGDFVNNIQVQNKISNSEEGNNEFLGGQNVYKAYSKLVPTINGTILTEYDEAFNNIWSDVMLEYNSGRIPKSEIVNRFKSIIKEQYPDIIVE